MENQVKHYMSKEVPTADIHTSVTDAAKIMSKKGLEFLIVLKEGRPEGMFTGKDLVEKVVAKEIAPQSITIGETMSSPLVTVDPDEDLLNASEIMQKKNVRRLPVVKDGIIYGILRTSDIARQCNVYVDRSLKEVLRWAYI